DRDSTQRNRTLPWLGRSSIGLPAVKDEGLSIRANNHHYGAVFLTELGSPTLRMLVNREGFVPEAGYLTLKKIVRTGLDLAVRVRATTTTRSREARREGRLARTRGDYVPPVTPANALRSTVQRATALASEARQLTVAGDLDSAEKRL